MKTLFSIIFSVLVIVLSLTNKFGVAYPFTTPRMLMFEWFVIGIPSFILAFIPNDKPISGKFIFNLIKNALPGAIALCINVGAVFLYNKIYHGELVGELALQTIATMSTLVLTLTGLSMLYRLCKPFNGLTTTLFVTMFAICCACFIFWPTFFDISTISALMLPDVLFVIILALVSPTVITILYKIMDKINF